MTRVIVVCGVPGVGKTTVSAEITDGLNGELLRTDVVRKDLIPDPDYTKAEEKTVYGELFDRARSQLSADSPVVLDGTFHDETYRERAERIAAEYDVPFQLVRVTCEESVVKERIRERTDDESDADFEVYQLLCDIYDPIEREHVTVDNSGSLSATTQQVGDLLPQTAKVAADEC